MLQCLHANNLQWGASLSPANYLGNQFSDVCLGANSHSDSDPDDIQNLGRFMQVLIKANSDLVESNRNILNELSSKPKRKQDSEIHDFITQCFKVKDQRPSARVLLQHSFI